MRILKATLFLAALTFGLWAVKGAAQSPARDEFVRTDPDKVVLAEACGECHRSEFAVWKTTPHATGFETLHRKESALEIAKAMGFFLIKRESLCLKCHYTPVVRRDTLRAGAGVTCESCHGAAKDWINVHNFFGVRESDFQKAKKLETPQHRQERVRNSISAGMLRPSNLYAVASNCFQCHTVPHEKLVNVGRHSTGSSGFELLSWSQGKIRHNFLNSFLTGDGTVNAERPPERKRLLYFVGRALDLEYSLRGIAEATDNGRYVKAMIRRHRNALSELREINSRTPSPELNGMLSAVGGLALKAGNREKLVAAADTVGEATRGFLADHDGTRLAGLDPLISGQGATRAASDAPPEDAEVAGRDTTGTAPARPADPDRAGDPPATTPTSADATPAAPTPTPTPAPEPAVRRDAPGSQAADTSVVGRIRTRPEWHPDPKHGSIGPEVCAGCHDHSAQDEWWIDDKHYASADPLLDENRKALRIARFYGISAADMKKGNQICMQCHGSIVSGKERRTVITGVGCESCHGKGADFKDPHQKSRADALGLGMVDLENLGTRALTCGNCHYITDPRLISAGHPTGDDFKMSERNARIQHWEGQLASSRDLEAAYRNMIADRGPLPAVARRLDVDTSPVRETSPPVTDSSPQTSDPVRPADRPGEPVPLPAASDPASTPAPGRDRPSGEGRSAPPVPAAAESPDLPPGRVIEDGLSVEEVLRYLKERLELLYKKKSDR